MRSPSESAARRALLLGFLCVFGTVALVVAIVFWAWYANAEPLRSPTIHVIDGDTVAVGGERYRLVGFDAPELRGRSSPCDEDRSRARAARSRLKELVAGGDAVLSEVACSCRPGTAGTRDCNHGRLCGRLTIDGQDVGDILIAEGLARPYRYDWRHPPRPANWCGR